ncbi:MAG TPA: ThiF family adenylyltransferase, partial [Promineifilum sp.]|nr:ThiF family adenylyltransferase [Promineifilum sp.]
MRLGSHISTAGGAYRSFERAREASCESLLIFTKSNRQWAANLTTLGRNKAEVYEELLRQINPDVRVRTHTEGITDANVNDFLAGADILIDCLDVAVAPALRAKMFAAARAAGLYAATGAM